MIVLTAFEAIPGAGTEAGLAWNWGQAYVAAGHNVTVLTSAGGEARRHIRKWQEAGIKVEFLGGTEVASAPQTPLEMLAVGRAVTRWARDCQSWLEAKADEVTAVHHVSWGSVRLQPPFLKVAQTMTTIWGPLGGGQLAKFSGILPKNRTHEIVRAASFPVGWVMRRLDFLRHRHPTISLATNLATFRYLRSLGIEKAEMMLADGVRQEMISTAFPKSMATGRIKLVWLGRMVASKRPDIALELVAELKRRKINASLTMVGDGPERISLESAASKLGISGVVDFVGRIPWARTFSYYDQSDFLVFTSMRDSSCPTVLEAAARGLPTLCLRHQGVEAMVPDFVALGPTNFSSVAELVRHLADLVTRFQSDGEAYKQASRDAVVFARSQTWDGKVAAVLGLIGEMAKHE